jgi:hypothetical protein
MKRQLIYHTHVNTSPTNKIEVCVNTDFTSIHCYLDRVSRDGLTLSCDAETLRKIMPNKASVAPKDPITLTTAFTLTDSIEAQCRVIFARRVSKDHFILELKFTEINEQATLHLDNYIEENLKSALNKSSNSVEQSHKKDRETSETLSSDVYQINNELKLTYSKVA